MKMMTEISKDSGGNMRVFFLVYILFFIINQLSAKGLEVSEELADYKNSDIFRLETDNVLKYSLLNALDNNKETAVWCMSRNNGTAFTPLEITLKTPVLVDSLRVQNGGGTNSGLYFVKDLLVILTAKGYDGLIEIVSNNLVLERNAEIKEYKLYGTTQAYKLELIPLTVYKNEPDELLTFASAGLASVEVGSGASWHQFENIETWKQNFLKNYQGKRVEEVLTNFSMVRIFEFPEPASDYAAMWANIGIMIKDIWVKSEKPFQLYISFTQEDDSGGSILTRETGHPLVEDKLNGQKFSKALEIGKWKVDLNGNLWIKLGNSDWKRQTNKLFWFQGTYLGGVTVK